MELAWLTNYFGTSNKPLHFICKTYIHREAVAYPGILFGEGSTNSVEDRENRDLGAVPP